MHITSILAYQVKIINSDIRDTCRDERDVDCIQEFFFCLEL